MQRAQQAGGQLIYRNEDLDTLRCMPKFSKSAVEDLRWFGINWDEGEGEGGAFGPYSQSKRTQIYLSAWEKLKNAGIIYPCEKSRKDVAHAGQAPHTEDAAMLEPIYPENWRPPIGAGMDAAHPDSRNWRFRVPASRTISFSDGRLGPCKFDCLKDFGDFLVWRKDGVPAYELAVVIDDAAMKITEVVRGEDLLISTARQLLIYEALQLLPPTFYHTPLMIDAEGRRLTKRNLSLSLRELREAGHTPNKLRQSKDWHYELN